MTIKKLLLFLRLWQYAAMHSKLFYACEIRFLQAPISVSATAWGCPRVEFLFRLSLSRPRLLCRFPYPIIKSFIDDANSRGESMSYLDVDSVLF
ncbi:hypothetical protein IQ244_20240 [Nostoc sp. LEGE 06077]|uniref:hypothetical protein n=1 Tax=Nostoc sp. LEGE 06077 TaxID=915325 RepID=UPI001881731C|nr:hypothetical protein [Nostoc sp. LEGE 06077]MBE9208829.1 hypothetical protein [Nostoc sp. LEGE 06077]